MKLSPWYGIFVGSLIVIQWMFFLITDSVPQLQTAPWEIAFHISAELFLAITLLVGGIATLREKLWSKNVLLVGLGMAIYSEINSPGYFAQLGQWALVVMFAVLLFGAVLSTMLLIRQGEPS